MKNLFKFLILLSITVALVFSFCSFIEQKRQEYITYVGENTLDGINSERYQDMLILYNADFERNEYGYELLVESSTGFVVDKESRVTLTDGTYILSGHGTAAEFLQEISIGDIIEIKDDRVVVSRDLFRSNLKIIELDDERLDEIIEYKIESLYDIDFDKIEELNKKISEAKRDFTFSFVLSKMDEERVNEKIEAINCLINQKFYCTVEERSVELRGLWHRPNRSGIRETDLSGVREFVKNLRDLGINTLYVETFWNGMTTYYSDYIGSAHPQMSNYNYGEYGNDYMLALISECHKEGIEVHAWFEALRVKYFRHESIDPDWIMYDLEGDKSECFMDPSNPEVKEFLLNIISEMLEKYDFDGISYDYIRYFEAGEFDGYKDGGFSDYSISLFTEKYGYEGKDLLGDVASNESVRALWQEFKVDNITSLVSAMTEHIRSIAPDIILSVSPYGHVEHAKSIYMQDIALWCEKGYVDVILPMIFTDDLEFYCETVESFNEISGNSLQVPGIYSLYNGGSMRETEELIDSISPLTFGNSIFASQNVIVRDENHRNEIMSILSTTSHANKAISPTADANDIFSAWKCQIYDRCERIYKNEMSDNEYSSIVGFCETEYKMEDLSGINDVLMQLELLCNEIKNYSNAAVRERLTEQIDYICEILRFHLNFAS